MEDRHREFKRFVAAILFVLVVGAEAVIGVVRMAARRWKELHRDT